MTRQLAGSRLDAWEGAAVSEWRGAWGVPRLEVFGLVGSTNDVARELAAEGAPHGTAVLAEEQSAGRGRAGRPWHSAPGWSVHLSLVLRPGGAPELLPVLPLRLGLATSEAVQAAAGVATAVKWPNDVLALRGAVPAGKLAGILCESSVTAGEVTHVIAGIGVNVGQDRDDFPPELRERATSLSLEAGRLVSRVAVLGELLPRVLRAGGEPVGPLGDDERRRLAERDALRGRRVRMDDGEVGTAVGIAADGALLVQSGTGRPRPVRGGTVRMVEGWAAG